MATLDLRSFFDQKLEWVEKSYAEDLVAMPEAQLSYRPSEKARTIYDFTYECAVINERIAKRIAGLDPGPVPFDGWAMAPADFQNKETCLAAIASSLKSVRDAWQTCPEERMTAEIELPNGTKTTPVDLVYMVCFHTGYHDAQLNYVQSLHGDMEMHWT